MSESMREILLKNFNLLDVVSGKVKTGLTVRIRDNIIVSIDQGEQANGADVIDLGGRVLMPGLIDCHVHVNRWILPEHPLALPSYVSARAGMSLKEILHNGFTTARDAGGADYGHKKAIEDGLFEGPRLFVSGRAISQTGGHGDRRSTSDLISPHINPHLEPGFGRIADGVPEVLRAVRDEVRLGADQIKVMAGGGVASAADPVDHLQYSMEELKAICEEAARARKYVMAHIMPDDGVRRCIEAGVRTIEHGFFITDDTARIMAEKGVYLSPNLLTTQIIANEGAALKYTEEKIAKAREIGDQAPKSVAVAKRAGVKICFASDLSRAPHRGCEEFLAREAVLTNLESIQSATIIGAEVCRMEGKIGTVTEGAFADLIAVDGNPLEDISLLARHGQAIGLIVKDGKVVKSTL